ncbi:hypothetical protein [Pontibacter rugosus]|uniref:Uncharacterized protein n=1 Tax=Pontibacter rugosus TaxID=1745966 RepID=A0ABW3SRB9_9BACT
MKKLLLVWLILGCTNESVWSQAPTSPYKTDWVKDGAIIAGGVGASIAGSFFN